MGSTARQFGVPEESSIGALMEVKRSLQGGGNWFAGILGSPLLSIPDTRCGGECTGKTVQTDDPDMLSGATEGVGWLGHWEWSHQISESAFQGDSYLFEKLRIFGLRAAMRMLAFSNSPNGASEPGPQAEERSGLTLHPAEFIDQLAEHVPDHYKHAIRHFGLLSPRTRGQTFGALFAQLGEARRQKPRRIGWASSIKRELGKNPLDAKGEDEMDLPNTCSIRSSSNGSRLL